MKRVILILLATLLALPVSAQKKKPKEDFIVFTPQWTAQAQFAGYYVAQELGFYEAEGIKVSITHPNVTQSAESRFRSQLSQATTLQLAQAVEFTANGISLVEWGTASGIGTGWYTLSNSEWGYLFNTRGASTVNSVADARYAKGKVNGVYGIILFPDTYTHPTGVTLPVGINEVGNTGWNGNNYSAADWTAMETAGCVFLPATGYREGTSVQSAGSSCSYRSSTRVTTTTDLVNYVYFADGSLSVSASNYGRYGQCVRLVKDAN